jgi:hypothetical protein
MSSLKWLKVFCAVGLLAASTGTAFADAKPSFEQEIGAVSERVYLMPRAVQPTLLQLQKDYAPLSAQRQALLYEQMGKAQFYTGDFHGALEHGKLLEALGKQSKDKSIECLGLLYQVFGNWKLGKIQVAYTLAHRARQFAPDTLSKYALVVSLLTTAQMAAENHSADEAVQATVDAIQLAKASNDSAILFMATQMQATVALSVGKQALAQAAMNRLLEQATRSVYPERLIRAKGMEYAVASAEASTARAKQAIAERLRLLRKHQLTEALAGTLINYADLELKSKHYAEAAALSGEALQQPTLIGDTRLSNSAHFSHAMAQIYLGKIDEGKAEVERLFTSKQQRTQLIGFLPEYAAVLTHIGDANASVQVGAIRRRLEFEEELLRTKVAEKANAQMELQARERQAAAAEASTMQSYTWLVIPISAIVGLIALIFLYRRAYNQTASAE